MANSELAGPVLACDANGTVLEPRAEALELIKRQEAGSKAGRSAAPTRIPQVERSRLVRETVRRRLEVVVVDQVREAKVVDDVVPPV